ncbi:MAG: AraC family transcriptional regulator, partial [Deltaproteobacteria bacterium HGW-Deltaproteobacteria-17]
MITTWEKLKVVTHMQDVIEAHLGEPITLAALTRGTGYSMWHAARMFEEMTGVAPFAYLRKRRLSAAAQRLSTGDARVVDVAFDFVFDSHEGFTRAFARQFGLTPAGFMKK